MKRFIAFFLFVSLFGLSACKSSHTISAKEGYDMMKKDDQIVLLDVRTQSEYQTKHIPGAYLLPLSRLQTDMLSLFPDLDQVFIIYCRSGNRSADALVILKSLGYKNVYDMGGILDWPYETESNLG